MATIVRVFFLPAELPYDLTDSAAVVIDVLRATTTIVAALEAGCRAVVPIVSLEETRAAAASGAFGPALTAGERGGVAIEGLDHANSPLEFRRERCSGRTLLLTTSNGSGAVKAAESRGAASVFAGSLWNAAAVARAALSTRPRSVALVCAGTRGEFTLEDALGAGVVVEAIARTGPPGSADLDDSALAALALRRRVGGDVVGALRASKGGRALAAIGGEADIVACAEIDRSASAPRLRDGGMLVAETA